MPVCIRPQLRAVLYVLTWILCWICLGKKTEEKLDIKYASEILDRDHYGLEKVKERVLEYLA